jgi:hypothetical protein
VKVGDLIILEGYGGEPAHDSEPFDEHFDG